VSLGAIEIGSRECAEDVWRIDQNGPERNHWNEWHNSGDVKNEQRIAGSHRADEPDQIIPCADNPSQRNEARSSLSNDFCRCGHARDSLTNVASFAVD